MMYRPSAQKPSLIAFSCGSRVLFLSHIGHPGVSRSENLLIGRLTSSLICRSINRGGAGLLEPRQKGMYTWFAP
jgi:hypothetical protein